MPAVNFDTCAECGCATDVGLISCHRSERITDALRQVSDAGVEVDGNRMSPSTFCRMSMRQKVDGDASVEEA